MKVNKLVSIVLVTVLLCTTFISSTISLSSVSAAEVEDRKIGGAVSGDYKYQVLDDGTAEITRYNGSATYLEIPLEIDGYSVTSIGYHAFEGCKSLTRITISDSVTDIGISVFSGCTNLTNIRVASNNQKYSSLNGNLYDKSQSTLIQYAIGKKDSSFAIPNSVKSIGYYAFGYCKRLTNVTIPNSVTRIGQEAFEGCKSLTSVTIPNSVTSIGHGAFNDCKSLTGVTIPNSVTSIGYYAFGYCKSLTNVTIPNSVTSIGYRAFNDCTSLTGVTIPSSVTSIGDYVFSCCTSLEKIEVENDNKEYSSLNGNLYDKSQSKLIQYAIGKKDSSFAIPNSVTRIGNDAFRGCTSLTGVTIPDSVTSIENGVFYGCTSLTNVTIPNSVTSIESSAFKGCTSLTGVTIPSSVTSIGDYVFSCCTSLEKIEVENDNKEYSSLNGNLYDKSQSKLIQYAIGKKDSSFAIPNSVTSIGSDAFYGCKSLTNVTIPNSVTSIGYHAFEGCTSLTNVVIPNSVTSIGKYAFENCTSLTGATIPNSVTSIGGYAFRGCISLANIEVDNNNQKYSSLNGNLYDKSQSELIQYAIGKKDSSFAIPNSVTSIESGAFYGCTSLANIEVNNNNQKYSSLNGNLYDKSQSTLIQYAIGKKESSFAIPNSVTRIVNDAFCGCKSLTKVTIPNSVKSIGDYAFGQCTGLTDIYYEGTKDSWNEVFVGVGNNYLYVANMHYKEHQNQTISLPKTSYIKKYGDKPFKLGASAETDLQYISSNTSVVAVSSDGTVTIKGSGSATITITALSDEQYNSAVKTVKITVNKATQTITAKSYTKKNGSKAFSLGAKTNGGGKLTYTTSNKNIATVSSKGVVSINGCGKATITIKASTTSKYNSAIKKVYITVLPSDVKITSLTGKGNTAKMTFKKQQGLSGYVVEISQKSNFSFKLSNILKGNRGDCNFRGCTKGKKYYARIRAFVKIGGKTYYSKWANRSFAIKR